MKYFLMPLRLFMDIVINIFFWLYFTVGFIVFLMPLYFFCFLVSRNHERAFQALNHAFYRVFFFLSRVIIPGLSITVPVEVRGIQSSVIICNHVSYIDPILLISLYSRQKTIVKGKIFKMPLFGWFLRHSGFVPFATESADTVTTMKVLENLQGFFKAGGNLFVFPEGTRMPRGETGKFNKGAFSLARRCNVPIELLYIRNTDRLMKPGNLWYSTCFRNPVSVEYLGRVTPDYGSPEFSLKGLIHEIRERYVAAAGEGGG